MKLIKNPHILLNEKISSSNYDIIDKLRRFCIDYDQTALKLELDYKLSASQTDTTFGPMSKVNEFMYFDGDELIGYIGICGFGGETIEVNGMVHPEYRRLGVFKKLFSLVQDEWYKRDEAKMLLLSDRKSVQGQQFIKRTRADFEHAEHEMYLGGNPRQFDLSGRISLRKATNADARELSVQNAIYFETEYNEAYMVMPEEEEKRGMTIYLAEMDGQAIGKINLELNSQLGAIFGFGVKPEFRRKGYGREILSLGIEKLKESNPKNVMLQVEVQNEKALNLYISCGFEMTSTMDYYEISK